MRDCARSLVGKSLLQVLGRRPEAGALKIQRISGGQLAANVADVGRDRMCKAQLPFGLRRSRGALAESPVLGVG